MCDPGVSLYDTLSTLHCTLLVASGYLFFLIILFLHKFPAVVECWFSSLGLGGNSPRGA